MEPIVERSCGLDVHKQTVVACLLVGSAGARPRRSTRTFGTTTSELEDLRAWLSEEKCTHVGMESTGVYWMPVFAVLEGHFELIVGNAAQIQNVPGRKTDVKDAEWIADLVRHGLIRKSFVPPKWQRGVRDLVRYRRKPVESETAERNRLLRLLETCNVKLSSVATDVLGVSGRAMVRALIEGSPHPMRWPHWREEALRKKTPRLTLALQGSLDDHHRFLLKLQLDRVERIEGDVKAVDARIDDVLAPHREKVTRLAQIPGVDRVVAATIFAELGTDMTVFPTSRHAAAWAGICPSSNESACKRGNQTKRHGNIHLATALVQAAFAAAKKRGAGLLPQGALLAPVLQTRQGVQILRAAGHDAVTVLDQGLGGGPDLEIFKVAQAEVRRKAG